MHEFTGHCFVDRYDPEALCGLTNPDWDPADGEWLATACKGCTKEFIMDDGTPLCLTHLRCDPATSVCNDHGQREQKCRVGTATSCDDKMGCYIKDLTTGETKETTGEDEKATCLVLIEDNSFCEPQNTAWGCREGAYCYNTQCQPGGNAGEICIPFDTSLESERPICNEGDCVIPSLTSGMMEVTNDRQAYQAECREPVDSGDVCDSSSYCFEDASLCSDEGICIAIEGFTKPDAAAIAVAATTAGAAIGAGSCLCSLNLEDWLPDMLKDAKKAIADVFLSQRMRRAHADLHVSLDSEANQQIEKVANRENECTEPRWTKSPIGSTSTLRSQSLK